MSNIETDKLIKLGATQAQVAEILVFLNTYEELSSATAEELVAMASSLDTAIASKIITLASIKSKGAAKLAAQEQSVSNNSNTITNTETVATNPLSNLSTLVVGASNASPSPKKNSNSKVTTVRLTVMRNDLTAALGVQPQSRHICTECQGDVDTWLETEPDQRLEDLKYCPYCERKIGREIHKKCYRCRKNLPTTLRCVSCQASASDSPRKKIATIWAQERLKMTAIQSQQVLENTIPDADFEEGMRENWIDLVENGNGLIPTDGGERPASNNAGRSFHN